ncbi:MAG: hypothetical protein Q8R08_04820 [bacterium]|nr:hypothetical protein [bacterium]
MDTENLENLLRLIKLIGGKFIIVEDGKPSAVIMDYHEFEDLASPVYEGKLLDRIEKVNEELTDAQLRDLREEVIAPWPASLADEEAENLDPEIRIEPLAQ